jgi:amino acid transporter
MGLWANMALGFTYLSPLVGVYSLFAYSLSIGGPPAIWWIVIVGAGQLLVALVFGEVVSQYPLAGGIYPWTRRLWNRRYAWTVSWIYIWAVIVTITAVAEFGGGFVAALFGVAATPGVTLLTAVGLLVVAFLANVSGTRMLAKVAKIGLAAELIGVIVLGLYLLLFQREQPFSVFFDAMGTGAGEPYAVAFLAASLSGLFLFYGFEACGDVAEEVRNPGIQIPKAMRRTIYIGGAASTFVCLSLILSVTDFGAVIRGDDPNPIDTILASAFGDVGSRIVLAIVLISFVSCALSLQAAASRLIFSYGRDGMIVGSRLLARFDHKRHVPPYSLLAAVIVPAALIIGSLLSEHPLNKLVSFGTVGVYLGFQMVVLAALRARLKGWKPSGKYRLGRWGMVVNVGALAYGLAAIVNICWPRTPDAPWYDNYVVLLMSGLIVGFGLLYMAVTRAYAKSDAPYADAVPRSEAPVA